MKKLTYALVLFSLLLLPQALSAKPHEEHGHGKQEKHGHHKSGKPHDSDRVSINISVNDRDIIREFLNDSYRPKNCPPGLAKKHNGCLPPGIAKKYSVGSPLGVGYSPLPPGLAGRLHPAPGYQYVMVDKDVLLIGEATKKVIDAVTLLSALD